MKKKWFLIGVIVSLVVLLLYWFNSNSSFKEEKPINLSKDSPEKRENISSTNRNITALTPEEAAKIHPETKRKEEQFQAAFKTPINFWGKIIDEKDNPIENAQVHFGATDKPWQTGSSYQRTSDINGLFSITDIQGMNLSVKVKKDGYYSYDKSQGSFYYYEPSDLTPENRTL